MQPIERYERLCAPLGQTGLAYLRTHFARFAATKQRLLSREAGGNGGKVLDVGAHWLHQALLYAAEGFEVTALDLPATLTLPEVRSIAQANGIQLLCEECLERPAALGGIPDNTFDLVLFTEIIEHLTFNPVAMWREIYRVMKPGARIVITTPNYYALRTRIRQWLRALQLLGAGISVDQILSLHTHAHHWKEYSRRELVRYFSALSPDFSCRNFAYVQASRQSRGQRTGTAVVLWVERLLPPIRPDLYLEVELPRKERGIAVEPHW